MKKNILQHKKNVPLKLLRVLFSLWWLIISRYQKQSRRTHHWLPTMQYLPIFFYSTWLTLELKITDFNVFRTSSFFTTVTDAPLNSSKSNLHILLSDLCRELRKISFFFIYNSSPSVTTIFSNIWYSLSANLNRLKK